MTEIPDEWKLLLPHENPDDYRRHVEGMLASHQPENPYETWLVEEFAAAAWCYRRARSIEASFLEDIGGSYNRGPAGVAQALFQEREVRLRNYLRFRAQAEREYNKALAAVERMRRDRDRRGARKLGAPALAVNANGPAFEAEPQVQKAHASAHKTEKPQTQLTVRRTDCYPEPVSELARSAVRRVEGTSSSPPSSSLSFPKQPSFEPA